MPQPQMPTNPPEQSCMKPRPLTFCFFDIFSPFPIDPPESVMPGHMTAAGNPHFSQQQYPLLDTPMNPPVYPPSHRPLDQMPSVYENGYPQAGGYSPDEPAGMPPYEPS